MIEHHDLRHEFPEFVDRIHDLKTSNDEFRALFDQYHELDREIRRMEEEIEPTSDDVLEEKKKLRLKLKDDLYAMLRAA